MNYVKKQSGYATLIAAFLVFTMMIIASGFLYYVVSARRASVLVFNSASAWAVAEAGAEKAIWMLNNTAGYNGETNTAFEGGEFDIALTDLNSSTKKIAVTAYIPNKDNPNQTRTLYLQAFKDPDASEFSYAVQAGEGGFEIGENSIIQGTVYSNGPINGSSNTEITGDAYSAGDNGLMDDVIVRGNAYARVLEDCIIDGNAYYQTIERCNIGGTSNPGSTDPEDRDMPISEEQINEMKAEAEAGGVITGDVTISSNQNLGPVKIEGNLLIRNNIVVTLYGNVWVTGNIDIQNKATLNIDSSMGSKSLSFVADGVVDVSNNIAFNGSGDPASYLFIISEYNSLTEDAIDINNNINGIAFYARNGIIDLNNNVEIKQVTAYKIKMGNNVTLIYEEGLQNVSFTSGPAAGWTFQKGTYVAP